MVEIIAAKEAMVAPRTVAPQVPVKVNFVSPPSTADFAIAFHFTISASHAALSLKHIAFATFKESVVEPAPVPEPQASAGVFASHLRVAHVSSAALTVARAARTRKSYIDFLK